MEAFRSYSNLQWIRSVYFDLVMFKFVPWKHLIFAFSGKMCNTTELQNCFSGLTLLEIERIELDINRRSYTCCLCYY